MTIVFHGGPLGGLVLVTDAEPPVAFYAWFAHADQAALYRLTHRVDHIVFAEPTGITATL